MAREYVKKENLIKMLKEGGVIYTRRKREIGKNGQTIYDSLTFYIDVNDGSIHRVHNSTINTLIHRKIISGGAEHPKYSLLKQTT